MAILLQQPDRIPETQSIGWKHNVVMRFPDTHWYSYVYTVPLSGSFLYYTGAVSLVKTFYLATTFLEQQNSCRILINTLVIFAENLHLVSTLHLQYLPLNHVYPFKS